MGPPAWRLAYDPLAVYSLRTDYKWRHKNLTLKYSLSPLFLAKMTVLLTWSVDYHKFNFLGFQYGSNLWIGRLFTTLKFK